MKKTLFVMMLCAALETAPLTLRAQSSSSSAPARAQAQQQELADTQRRLVELQAQLAQTQKSVAQVGRNTRSSDVSRPSQVRRTTVVSNAFPSWMGAGPQSGVTLVVPVPGAGPEDILNVQDDLQVMSRFLQKQLEQAGVSPPGTDSPFMVYT